MRYVAVALLFTAVTVVAQSPAVEFDVASIRRNTSNELPIGPPPSAATGDIVMRRVPARTIILQAYPVATLPIQIVNLPSWTADTYDLMAKGRPNPTLEERQQMFRALLADRMKLVAHYEMREAPGYDLVVARPGTLGPRLKPSTLDCSGPPAPPPPLPQGVPIADAMKRMEEQAQARCGVYRGDNSWISGGAPFDNLVRLITPAAGRPIVNKTGLQGSYAFALRYQQTPPPAGREPLPDDPPALTTALQEQLGLKLEPTTTQAQVLVIDHVERPTEN